MHFILNRRERNETVSVDSLAASYTGVRVPERFVFATAAAAEPKPRLVVMTDIGGLREANHAPQVICNGDTSRQVLQQDVQPGEVSIAEAETAEAMVTVPPCGAGQIHVIPEVTDDGNPPLTAYRCVILIALPIESLTAPAGPWVFQRGVNVIAGSFPTVSISTESSDVREIHASSRQRGRVSVRKHRLRSTRPAASLARSATCSCKGGAIASASFQQPPPDGRTSCSLTCSPKAPSKSPAHADRAGKLDPHHRRS